MQEKNRHLYEMPVLKFEMKKGMNAYFPIAGSFSQTI